MDIISFFFPTHLLIACITSLCFLILVLGLRKTLFKQRKWLWISLIVFLGVYLFLVLSAVYLSNYYQWELQKFDLDGNSNISSNEQTAEREMALKRVTKETARNFSFITGLFFAFVVAGITFLVGQIYEVILRRFR